MQDKLVDIPIEDLPILRELYKGDWPKNHVGYYTIDNYIGWFAQDPNVPHIKIYSLNNDWTDGTFIITDRSMLLVNTLSEDQHRLASALSLIDFSKGYIIASFLDRCKDTIVNFVNSKGFQQKPLCTTKWYVMSRTEGTKLTVQPPAGITLKRLTLEHAAIANELWPFRSLESAGFLERLTKYNVSYGAFTTDGELVAWCFRHISGALGAIQVIDTFKRKGLATVLIKAMAKEISDMDQDVCAAIVINNFPSLNLFEKLGFEAVDKMYWLSVTSSEFVESKD